ncbi:unnamed protein product [Caenorhabditis sp. 36 PRJEB53466]|nr:unnamed protein product [Caenorhabditis sp. 36 PRJEB53466]
MNAKFSSPKPKTSDHYREEIQNLLDDLQKQCPPIKTTLKSCLRHEPVFDCKQLFEDLDVDYQLEMDCKQVFVGSQQIAVKTIDGGNCLFIADDKPRFVLNLIKEQIVLTLADVLGISVHRAAKFAFRHIIVLTLSTSGSECMLKNYPSLKQRLSDNVDKGMLEEENDLHKSTLILVMKERNFTANTPIATLRVLDEPNKAFQANEETWFKVFCKTKEKLEKLNLANELLVDELDSEHLEEIKKTLGLVWLKEGKNWTMRDKRHFLSVTPTPFMEHLTNGICELTLPSHWVRPLARKRMLPLNNNSLHLEQPVESNYSVIRCSPRDYSPLLQSKHAKNLVYRYVEVDISDESTSVLEAGMAEQCYLRDDSEETHHDHDTPGDDISDENMEVDHVDESSSGEDNNYSSDLTYETIQNRQKGDNIRTSV